MIMYLTLLPLINLRYMHVVDRLLAKVAETLEKARVSSSLLRYSLLIFPAWDSCINPPYFLSSVP